MPAVLNCLDKENKCTVGGNTFTFKPGQLKYFHDRSIATAIDRLKRDDGFLMVSDDLEELAHLKEDIFEKVITSEQRAAIAEKRVEGIANYCKRLRDLIYNATVSLQRDIDVSGRKYDARVEATKADLNRLKELAHYQASKNDEEQQTLDEFKKLESQVAKSAKA